MKLYCKTALSSDCHLSALHVEELKYSRMLNEGDTANFVLIAQHEDVIPSNNYSTQNYWFLWYLIIIFQYKANFNLYTAL